MAAARVAKDAFLFMAGDTCHGRACYCPGVRQASEVSHVKVTEARQTVGKLARLEREHANAVVVLAHEKEREEEMPMFPNEINEWVVEEVEKKKAKAVKAAGREKGRYKVMSGV